MAVGFVSVIAVPVGLVLSFLDINASQVNSHASMFSHRYFPMYLAVACVIVAGALLAVAMYLRNRHFPETALSDEPVQPIARYTLHTVECI